MLKLLVKKQLTEIFRAYLYDAKKNRARSKAATVGYIIFFVFIMVGIIGGMFTLLSLAMCQDMAKVGMSWFYFCHHGPYGHPAGCLRQRVHHLFQPLPAQGQ